MSSINQLQLAMGLLLLALVCLFTGGIAAYVTYTPEANASTARKPAALPDNPIVALITDPIAPQGKSLFQNSCSSCHSPGSDVILGPGLQGINQRRSEDWLIKWIRNSQQVVQSGDAYAVLLYNKFKPTVMPPFQYSDKEIKAILTFLQ
jgi:mono/diheme cytochrome c family protein